jgi:hypothetical protein
MRWEQLPLSAERAFFVAKITCPALNLKPSEQNNFV